MAYKKKIKKKNRKNTLDSQKIKGRGGQKITSHSPPNYYESVIESNDEDSGIWGLLTIVWFAFLIYVNWSPSAPVKPTPPVIPSSYSSSFPPISSSFSTKAALFKSASKTASIDSSPLEVLLVGGSYEINYFSSSTVDFPSDLANKKNVFIGNFETNKTTGNINNAENLLLIGDLKVQVGSIYDTDILTSQIIKFDNNEIIASFKYYATHPIKSREFKKNIYIWGSIQDIYISDSFDYSRKEITYLELNSIEQERRNYNKETYNYEREKEEYDIKMIRYNADKKIRKLKKMVVKNRSHRVRSIR